MLGNDFKIDLIHPSNITSHSCQIATVVRGVFGGCTTFPLHFPSKHATANGLLLTDLGWLALSARRCEIKRLSLSELGKAPGGGGA